LCWHNNRVFLELHSLGLGSNMLAEYLKNCEVVFAYLFVRTGWTSDFVLKFGTFGAFKIEVVGDKHPTTPTTPSVNQESVNATKIARQWDKFLQNYFSSN